TATATTRVRSDIQSSLRFSQSGEFVASFNRENLFIEVAPKRNATERVFHFLDRFQGQPGIIYCFSRRQVDDLTALLVAEGYSALPYHAGLTDDARRRNQETFIRDDAQIMVATIAFGMGINKPNVRFVLHYDLPKSIESYYQEIGRAGRDGLPAHCLLLYRHSDATRLRHFINQKDGAERNVAQQHLDAMVRYAEDQINCRRKPLLAYFGERYSASHCGNCDNCVNETPQVDITTVAQKLLSCIVRTGEKFGAVHIIRILRGSADRRILELGHDRLSTYGIGRELEREQWHILVRQLLQTGYLEQGEYEGLRLTPVARQALKERLPVMGRFPERDERTRKKSGMDEGKNESDETLFALLRARLKQMADEAGVPPYVIFSDRTLTEMAARYPRTDDQLLDISGIGRFKLQKYGGAFLEVIEGYCQQHNISAEVPYDNRSVRRRVSEEPDISSLSVGAAFDKG
ncbi:MAG: RecQ family ATP-dependent DNA helicase, partial [Anaerolineae bacterium]|nr:RecQ family ATP-dependent DNA helicase [Anaerolineae bacterium]